MRNDIHVRSSFIALHKSNKATSTTGMGKIIKEDRNFVYCIQRERKFYLLQQMAYPLVNCYFHLLTRIIAHFRRKEKPQYRYQIALILIFKNEAPYLEEWLCHHINLGVEHFYLYDNNSTDNYKEILAPYIDRGIVTLTPWSQYPGQYSAYKHWYDNYRTESKWVSFIDADEFLCPTRENTLQPLLKQYDGYPVILMYWKIFGTSGLIDHDYSRLVTEQYTVSWEKLFTEGKIFYNTAFDIAEYPISMHGFDTRWKCFRIPPINIFKKVVIWNIHKASSRTVGTPPIQVNHYWSKAYNCWKAKYEKGSIEKGVKWKDFHFFDKLEKMCVTTDHNIFRFIIDIKLRQYEHREAAQSPTTQSSK